MKKYKRNILVSKKDELSQFIKKYGVELGIIRYKAMKQARFYIKEKKYDFTAIR